MCAKKAVPRSKLIGMQVYNADATFLGTVKDIGFVPGEELSITLIISTKGGGEVEVDWSKVDKVGDIVILKEVVEVPVAQAPAAEAKPVVKEEAKPAVTPEEVVVNCPSCGKPAAWFGDKKRWYCYNCKKWLPKSLPPPPTQVNCPTCGKPATYLSEYKKWYCYNCKKYV